CTCFLSTSFFPSCSFLLSTSPATSVFYTLSLHDALPISFLNVGWSNLVRDFPLTHLIALERAGPSHTRESVEAQFTATAETVRRSEEHTSELQSPCNLVCRLLLEKKKKYNKLPDTQASVSIYAPAQLHP